MCSRSAEVMAQIKLIWLKHTCVLVYATHNCDIHRYDCTEKKKSQNGSPGVENRLSFVFFFIIMLGGKLHLWKERFPPKGTSKVELHRELSYGWPNDSPRRAILVLFFHNVVYHIFLWKWKEWNGMCAVIPPCLAYDITKISQILYGNSFHHQKGIDLTLHIVMLFVVMILGWSFSAWCSIFNNRSEPKKYCRNC